MVRVRRGDRARLTSLSVRLDNVAANREKEEERLFSEGRRGGKRSAKAHPWQGMILSKSQAATSFACLAMALQAYRGTISRTRERYQLPKHSHPVLADEIPQHALVSDACEAGRSIRRRSIRESSDLPSAVNPPERNGTWLFFLDLEYCGGQQSIGLKLKAARISSVNSPARSAGG